MSNDKQLGTLNGKKIRFLEFPKNGDYLIIVKYDENLKTTSNGYACVHLATITNYCDEMFNSDGEMLV